MVFYQSLYGSSPIKCAFVFPDEEEFIVPNKHKGLQHAGFLRFLGSLQFIRRWNQQHFLIFPVCWHKESFFSRRANFFTKIVTQKVIREINRSQNISILISTKARPGRIFMLRTIGG